LTVILLQLVKYVATSSVSLRVDFTNFYSVLKLILYHCAIWTCIFCFLYSRDWQYSVNVVMFLLRMKLNIWWHKVLPVLLVTLF